ncbi:exported hypothetical protein [Candidatus Defluviicoccus seviourii]|uniref:Uncharacterized protein n=1 Tax=Candidatus Defluviicoccus seviourii TaxID=2565273 RepID=A0A564WGV6_9PROT|nr:exported hypothetical protein [Candidatus Defluviicoccus seviourii]
MGQIWRTGRLIQAPVLGALCIHAVAARLASAGTVGMPERLVWNLAPLRAQARASAALRVRWRRDAPVAQADRATAF